MDTVLIIDQTDSISCGDVLITAESDGVKLSLYDYESETLLRSELDIDNLIVSLEYAKRNYKWAH